MTEDQLLDPLFLDALRADRNLLTRQELEQLLADPFSTEVGRVHDWRNYLTETVADEWASLSLESRLIAFISAAASAHAEEWD
jgi:hypothetical protein